MFTLLGMFYAYLLLRAIKLFREATTKPEITIDVSFILTILTAIILTIVIEISK
jgi:hypothetical protein